MKTRVVPRNFEKVDKFIQSLPDGLVPPVMRAFTAFYLKVFRGYNPPYKYVSRKRAGYTTSPAQIRFMFATGILESDGEGGIILNQYERTGETAKAWNVVSRGKYAYSLVNPTKGAYYTMSDEGQARQPKLIGWKKTSKLVTDNLKDGIQVIKDALVAAARTLGIK